MIGFLSVLGWLLFGSSMSVLTGAFAALSLILGQRASPKLVLRLYGARPAPPEAAPQLCRLVHALSVRTGLAATPKLYSIPSGMISAFTVGSARESMIAVTEGLPEKLKARELQRN